MATEELRAADKTKPDYRESKPINKADNIFDNSRDSSVVSELKTNQI
jgi:hypothetical protein